ncbi:MULTISPECIES: sensor histidine kinase [Chryseobacterium]|uniref:histidine kinase n=1 Tax=Chryseobacterium taihuense TaxID=1141221 RepID=A0A4V6IDB4_9FLAO|nr:MULTISPECIES: HAMP domain-containing sensor histidine kinase [Chryseobacterium]QQV03887.1 HAMP domain-containing histidine kinase [Chryseobacterium sp. FDAARGOS 1104]VFB02764.1 Sensor kinase CusS [Chryseobacterium taihuense]
MKNLLNKSLKPLTVFAFVVFALSIPTYFLLVDWIWLKELDENNELIAQRIENEFNDQQISNEKLEESIQFWNEIQPLSKIEPVFEPLKKDSIYSIRRQNPYIEKKSIDRFRGLITNIKINNLNYTITIETNVEESEETVVYIAVVTFFLFLVLLVGFWILNKRLSKKIWKPFKDTLQKLKSFQLNNHTKIQFSETDITEFQELNTALDKLLQHSISTYKSQKEFTENASHELQTPIAIIKNKLDVLLQDKSLTDKQYDTIEEINLTLTRMSRINKNLLLLAKIENRQFANEQEFYLSEIISNSINELEDFISDKNIELDTKILENPKLKSNQSLAEILVSNLLLNAVRYSENGSTISITLTKNELIISNKGNQELDKTTLFDRFKKISPHSKGSGLGLAIVKEICNNNTWEIDYQFEDNQHHFMLKF